MSADPVVRARQALAAVVRAQEAVQDGDDVVAFHASLEADLVDLVDRLEGRASGLRCRICGSLFRWPGQLDSHARWVHRVAA